MIDNQLGHIVNVASLAGHNGTNKLVDYCASKFATVGLDESLRVELFVQGHSEYIKTTIICPYYINTGMFDGVSVRRTKIQINNCIPSKSSSQNPSCLTSQFTMSDSLNLERPKCPILIFLDLRIREQPFFDLYFQSKVISILDPEYVADQSVRGVRLNQEIVFLPYAWAFILGAVKVR